MNEVKTGQEGSSSWGDEETVTTVTKTERSTVTSSMSGSGVSKEEVETTSTGKSATFSRWRYRSFAKFDLLVQD